jgi:hypothetical protein
MYPAMGHDMTLVPNNSASCTGDKNGDGEFIAYDAGGRPPLAALAALAERDLETDLMKEVSAKKRRVRASSTGRVRSTVKV